MGAGWACFLGKEMTMGLLIRPGSPADDDYKPPQEYPKAGKEYHNLTE